MGSTVITSYFEVNGHKLWYERIGSGPHPILLIPDTIGTGRTDFDQLLEGEDELDYKKFTAIAVEPIGSGKSRPPIRSYGHNFYENDCDSYYHLMEHLGYDKYSIIGYSEGAKVAFLMAAKYPNSVHSMVLSAFSTQISNKGLKAILSMKSIEKWSNTKINAYLRAYESKEEIQKLWNRYLKFVEFYNQYYTKDIFIDKYKLIRCRILFTHGDLDTITEAEQPLQTRLEILTKCIFSRYDIDKKIKMVQVHRFPLGERDSHIRYAPHYRKLVQDHFLNSNE